MTDQSHTKKIIIIILIIVLLGILYFVLYKRNKSNSDDTLTNATSTTVTSTSTDSGITLNAQGNGAYTITEVPLNEGKAPQPIPSTSRPVTFNESLGLSVEAKSAITKKIIGLQANVSKNPLDILSWVNLGIYQKMGGDYTGARISWEYATKILPSNFVAYGNLADLYAYYIHDNGLAETNFKLAISKDPTQESSYTKFVAFYRDVMKDNTKARAVVEQGLAKLPNNANLLQLKASLGTQ